MRGGSPKRRIAKKRDSAWDAYISPSGSSEWEDENGGMEGEEERMHITLQAYRLT